MERMTSQRILSKALCKIWRRKKENPKKHHELIVPKHWYHQDWYYQNWYHQDSEADIIRTNSIKTNADNDLVNVLEQWSNTRISATILLDQITQWKLKLLQSCRKIIHWPDPTRNCIILHAWFQAKRSNRRQRLWWIGWTNNVNEDIIPLQLTVRRAVEWKNDQIYLTAITAKWRTSGINADDDADAQ